MKRIPPHMLAAIAQKYRCEQLVIFMRGRCPRRPGGKLLMRQRTEAYGTTAADQAFADYIAKLLRGRKMPVADD